MIWLGLIKRFWPYIAFAFGAALILGGIYRTAYKAGQREREAHYQPLFAAADKARAAADARTASLEASSKALTATTEARYAETLQSLETRAADADVRVGKLMRQLATRPRSCEVSAIPGAAPEPDDSSEVLQRADAIGARLVGVGRDCEADAAQLATLQRWIEDQRAILSSSNSASVR